MAKKYLDVKADPFESEFDEWIVGVMKQRGLVVNGQRKPPITVVDREFVRM